MLQLILGRSGSGKTHRIYREIAARAAAGDSGILLIVPEQFSFEAERALLRLLGVRMAGSVRVLSFTRMADAVAKELGGLSRRVMDEVTRILLMSRALTETADQLTLYRHHAGRADYVTAVLEALTECKQYAVTPRMLTDAAAALPEGTLRQKLVELSLIMETYEAMTADSYLDPADLLTRLSEQLPRSALGKGSRIYVDGFKGFTRQELGVMEQLMRRGTETVVALCTDTLDASDEYALFAPVTRTASRLVAMAREAGIQAAVEHLTGNRRTGSPALQALEKNSFSPLPQAFSDLTDDVTVLSACDRYEECRYLARGLRRLLREEGLRCRDIAVTARNLEEYRGIIDVALKEAGIPFYMDQREEVATEPLPALLSGALRCVTAGFQAEHLLQIMKTGLLGLSPRSVGLVENYMYIWRLSGSRLRQEWTGHPDGLGAESDEETDGRLFHLNLLRRRIMDPLAGLASELKGEISGFDFAAALYRYLERARVARIVRLQYRRLIAAGEEPAAERLSRLWDMMMELLDRFGSALRTVRMSASRFEELLALGLSVLDMGSIPQGLDAVQVGAAHRMRFSSPRAVWILGANEGVFPAFPAGGSLITDRDRITLAAMGVELPDAGELKAVEERLYAYFALSAPSEKLFISFIAGVGEEALPPSELVKTAEEILPGLAGWEPGMPESVADAFRALGEGMKDPSGETGALEQFFAEQEAYKDRLAAMGRVRAAVPFAFSDPQKAADFFGRDMRLSASQVEQFYNCPFAYFCQYGLAVRPRRRAELDSLESGLLTHYVMQKVLPAYKEMGFAAVSRERVEKDVQATVNAYAEEKLGGLEDKNRRFKSTLAKIVRTVSMMLWQVVREFAQSRFLPEDFELEIGEKGIAALPIDLPDGARVRMIGTVDRVDTYRREGKVYLRVIDYKTGGKEFRLDQVVQGIKLQMLMYIFALWDNGALHYGGETAPAGALYMPAVLPVVNGSRQDPEIEGKRDKCFTMNGILLEDPEIIAAMESDEAELFIPASVKNGKIRGKSLASLARFGELKQRVEQLLRQMGESLQRGDVAALPARFGKEGTACDRCRYKAVCAREAEDPGREIFTLKDSEVWQMLEGESGSDLLLDGNADV